MRFATRPNLLITPTVCLLAAFRICLPIASHAQQDRQLVQTGSQNQTTSKRIALVIGNGAYTSAPPLKNPPNDARDMAATLRTLGFDVVSGINVNQKDMKRLIREFGIRLKNGGSGLFYYAGHGVQSKGRNYLIPTDADILSEAEVEDSGVDVGLVLNFMDDAQNGLNIVILDACRNNPFARSFRSASDGLAQVDAPTGTLIAYATAPGRVASDGTAQNGLYTAELLKQMRVPGVSVTDMFMRVRAEVMKQTGNKQVPWEASSLVGAFYFIGAPGESNAAANVSKIDPTAFELSYWDTIKNSQSADDFKAYLEKYPEGQFAALAKNKINALGGSTKPVESKAIGNDASATELAFWDTVKASSDPEDFRSYLEKYPNGQFAPIAKRRLGNAVAPATPPTEAEVDKAVGALPNLGGQRIDQGQWGESFITFSIVGRCHVKLEYRNFPNSAAPGSHTIEQVDIPLTGVNIESITVEQVGPADRRLWAVKARTNSGYFFTHSMTGYANTKFEKVKTPTQTAKQISDSIGLFMNAESANHFAKGFSNASRLCALIGSTTPNDEADGNPIVSTTWKGDSPGGDKHYQVQFLPNGRVIWNLKWNNYGEAKGSWRQEGNTITLELDGYLKPVIITLNGETMNGSWSGGQYKFTLTKVQ